MFSFRCMGDVDCNVFLASVAVVLIVSVADLSFFRLLIVDLR